MANTTDRKTGSASVIVHLSDLHVGQPFDKNLEYLLLREIPRLSPDVIIVSGDLADQPRPRWFRRAAHFLHDLRERCEKSSDGRRPSLLVVPGNHDVKIYGNVSAGFWGRMCFEVYFRDCDNAKSVPTFSNCAVRYAQWMGKATWAWLRKDLGWAKVRSSGIEAKIFARGNLVALLYDSNDTCVSAQGRVRAEQISETRSAIEDRMDSKSGETSSTPPDPMALRIAVVHHHPVAIPYADSKSITNLEGFLVLENAGTFMREMVVNDIDLVLHGHKHYSNFSRVSYQLSPIERGEIAVLSAGTATITGGNGDGKNSYNVIRLYESGRAEVEIWEYGTGRSRQYAQHTPYPFELHTTAGYKQRAFRLNWKAHQVRAKCLTITKRLFSDGRAKVTHTVEGLVVGDRLVDGYEFEYNSDTGLVRCPQLSAESSMAGLTLVRIEENSEKNVPEIQESKAEKADEKTPLTEPEKSLRRAQSFHGIIHFNRSLNRTDQLSNFEFNFHMVNCDALSDWEFELLYPMKDRTDATLHETQDLLEWFEQIIWFPTERLRMIVELPEEVASVPFLDVFRIAGAPTNVDRGVIIRQSSFELEGSERQRDAYLRAASETALVRGKEKNSWVLSVDHPPVGRGYAMCWKVPEGKPRRVASALISEAEVFRKLLLDYRDRRRKESPESSPVAKLMRDMFGELFDHFRKKYTCLDPDEEFDLVMMTYDRQDNHLKVIEGLKNGKALPQAYWDFWLPPGVGNAGSCFKTASVRIYVAEEISPEYDYYLPVAKTPPHKVLVSLPVDHPDFAKATEKEGNDYSNDRHRQVVAIFNLGSTCKASQLRQLYPDPVLGPTEEKQTKSAVLELQRICQGTLNKIWQILTARPIDKGG